jgi:hypothetical protein
MASVTAAPAAKGLGIPPLYIAASAIALVAMFVAIFGSSTWFLRWVHVMSGVLWTGIDLFLGFVLGPVLRRLPFETRRTMIGALIPRTMILMPTLSIITGTAGWFLAQRLGFLQLGYPEFWWVAAALFIITVLTIQGLGVLTPINIRVFLEMRKPNPDSDKIARWMKTYVRVVAIQGAMQVAIIVVMTKFSTGL